MSGFVMQRSTFATSGQRQSHGSIHDLAKGDDVVRRLRSTTLQSNGLASALRAGPRYTQHSPRPPPWTYSQIPLPPRRVGIHHAQRRRPYSSTIRWGPHAPDQAARRAPKDPAIRDRRTLRAPCGLCWIVGREHAYYRLHALSRNVPAEVYRSRSHSRVPAGNGQRCCGSRALPHLDPLIATREA
jgi:hypothetical protein